MLPSERIGFDVTPSTNDHTSNIVIEALPEVFTTYETIYSTIIDCGLDFDKAFECFKFSMRYTMGRILYYKNIIGITISQWDDIYESKDDVIIEYINDNHQKLLDNPSEFYIEYYKLPLVRQAMKLVGLTEQDVIDDIDRLM